MAPLRFVWIPTLLILGSLAYAGSEPAKTAPATSGLTEVWAYISESDTTALKDNLPISDLAWFAADINAKGQLVSLPTLPKKLPPGVRNHLVLAETESMSLKHFVLNPAYPLREALLVDLVEAAKPYHGVNIDFEQMATYDKANYLSFLVDLKARLGTKVLSVALPARTRTIDEYFDYLSFAAVVDRVIVMAYDEHWSGSKPGPIASIAWGKKVADFGLQTIGAEKLIMGLPFYGRVWANENPAKAYRFPTISTLIDKHEGKVSRTPEEIPTVTFTKTITYTAYFEDRHSVLAKVNTYKNQGVKSIGFWLLGQEDPEF